METAQHGQLKDLALAFMLQQGCCAAAAEVRCPISRYRVDAAGYMDRPKRDPREPGIADGALFDSAPSSSCVRAEPSTVMIECKQSRADYLRDSRRLDRLLEQRRVLDAARVALEEQIIRVAEPHLRCEGSSLFRELEDWEFTSSRMPSYRKIASELRALDEQIHGQTKFWLAARYRLADLLYIAAPAGLIHARELPPGWGLLESDLIDSRDSQPKGQKPLRIKVRCTSASARPDRRARLLRNIAVAATNRLARLSIAD